MEKDEILGIANFDPSLVVRELEKDVKPYPFQSVDTGEIQLASAKLYNVNNAGNDHDHLVVLACVVDDAGRPDWHLWCGDNFLEGKTPDNRGEELAKTLGKRLDAGVAAQLQALHGAVNESHFCHFWKQFEKGDTCKHCKQVANELQDAVLDELATTLRGWQYQAGGAAAPKKGRSEIETLAFRVPVLLEGDRGAGKTHEVRSFAMDNGYPYLEMAGHESFESYEMMGHMVPAPGGMVWKDGKLAQAFRMAQAQKVVLSIDEMLRIPQKHLTPLLTALSPFKGEYRLTTGRIVNVVDGVGEEEVLTCKVENLAVFGTTNVGYEYGVEENDPALAERFMLLRRDTTPEMLRGILRDALGRRGFDPGIAAQLIEFFKKAQALVQQGQLNRHPTTRTLVRAIDLAETQDEIPKYLEMQALQWVDRTSDGRPVKEQLTMLSDLIKKMLPPPAATAKPARARSGKSAK